MGLRRDAVEVYDDYVAAAYLSPAGYDKTNALKPGYLALVKSGGSYVLTKTRSMTDGRLLWNSNGLFFADPTADYWLRPGNKPHIINNDKADYQDGYAALSDGIRHIGVYNVGFAEGGSGYDEEITLSDKASVYKTPWKTTLAIDTMPVCGDSVHALQMVPSTDDSSLLEYQDRRLVTLAIDGKVAVDDSRMPVHEKILQESEVGSTQPPCVNGDIIFVSMQSADDEMEMQNTKSSEHDSLGHDPEKYIYRDAEYPGRREYLTLERWSTRDGSRVVLPLVDENGRGIRRGYADTSGEGFDAASVQDGWLYWVDDVGNMTKTNISNGVTVEIGMLGKDYPGNLQQMVRIVHFEKGHARVWHRDVHDQKVEVKVRQYDLRTGSKTDEVSVPGLNEFIRRHGVYEDDFAVNPDAFRD